MQKLMQLKEAQHLADVSRGTLLNYINKYKTLPAVKSAGKWYIAKADLIRCFPHIEAEGRCNIEQ